MAKKTNPASGAAKPVELAEQVEMKPAPTVSDVGPGVGPEVVAKSYEPAVEVTKVVEVTKEKVEKVSPDALKTYGDIAALGHETFEAYVQSGTVFAKGMESLNKELMTFARETFDSNIKTAQALFGARNLREAIDVQSEFSRTSLDQVLSESAKLTEMSVQMTNEAIQPIQTRVTVAFDKIVKPIAA